MTWSFGSPDGRATFESITVEVVGARAAGTPREFALAATLRDDQAAAVAESPIMISVC